MGQFYNISDPEEMSINGIPYGEISLFKGIYKETKSISHLPMCTAKPCDCKALYFCR